MNRFLRFNSRKSHHRVEAMGIRKVIARQHSDGELLHQQQSKQRSPTKKSLSLQRESQPKTCTVKCDKSSETEDTIPHFDLSMSQSSCDDEKNDCATNAYISIANDSQSCDQDEKIRFIGDILEYDEDEHHNEKCCDRQPSKPPLDDQISLLALQASKKLLDSHSKTYFEEKNLTIGKKQLDYMGNSLVDKGEFDQAIEKYLQALYLKRRALMAQRENVQALKLQNYLQLLASIATSVNNIAFLLHSLGRTTTHETLDSYGVALQIKREVLGSDNLSVGKTLNNIGSIHYLQQDFHKAAETYEQARDILQLHLGYNHLDVCTVSANLGDVHCSMKQWSRAVKEYRSALEQRWALFGPSDPKVIRLMEQVAELEMSICQQRAQEQDSANTKLRNAKFYGPITKDVRKLQKEVQRDIDHLNTLTSQMPLEMIKDKVAVFREIRELMNDDVTHALVTDDIESDQNSDERVVVDTKDKYGSTAAIDAVVMSGESCSTPTADKRFYHRSVTSKSPTNLSPAERKEALCDVKEKLAKLRASKQTI